MLTAWLGLGFGLLALVAGGELLVRGSVAAAHRLGLSPMLIGLVLIGIGTSAPELVTSLKAALSGAPGLAVGNVVGSNVANILLVLGITAAIAPITVSLAGIKRDAGVMVAASVLGAMALLWIGGIPRWLGLAFLLLVATYLAWAYLSERTAGDQGVHAAETEQEIATTPSMTLSLALLITAIGLALTLAGADFLVDGAVRIAKDLGLSDALIGLTIVAIGTSLPELTAGIIAALRKHPEVALGNVLGSNIFNILLILGATGAVAPITTPTDLNLVEVGAMLVAAAVIVPIALTGSRISRGEGCALLTAYLGYLAWLIL